VRGSSIPRFVDREAVVSDVVERRVRGDDGVIARVCDVVSVEGGETVLFHVICCLEEHALVLGNGGDLEGMTERLHPVEFEPFRDHEHLQKGRPRGVDVSLVIPCDRLRPPLEPVPILHESDKEISHRRSSVPEPASSHIGFSDPVTSSMA